MALFGPGTRKHMLVALRRDLRLLLPADPGRDRLIEYVHLFDPRARPAMGGRIDVGDERDFYITEGLAITPEVAAEAGVPAGMTMAYFVQNSERGVVPWGTPLNSKQELYVRSERLMNGLAVRMGGVAWPEAPVLGEPLRATVYTFSAVTAEQVYEVVARYAPGLAPYADPSLGSINVSTWRTGDGQFELQHWPGRVAALLPGVPRGVGDEIFYHRSESRAVRLELSTPANLADPHTARLLGQCALEVAAMSDGVCVDQLDFRLRDPGELVFPRPSAG
jgi:hypothetical protein